MISTYYPQLRTLMRSALAFLAVIACMGLPVGAQLQAYAQAADASRPSLAGAVPSDSTGTTLPEPATAGQDLSVEQILDKHYEVSGGDRNQAIQTSKITGVSVLMGMEAPYTRFAKRPNKVLLEIYVQGMTGVQAYDGKTAWWFMPFMGHAAAEQMPPDMARSMVEGAEFDGPLVNAEAKGHEVKLLGIEQVAGADTYKLEVTLATGGTQTHYLDTETFYTLRVESAGEVATFKDFKLVDGVPIPHLIEMMGEMGEQIVYVETAEFGVEIEDASFSMR